VGLKARILRCVAPLPDGPGPATKAVLRGLCRDDKQRAAFPAVLRELLGAGELLIYGERKGARYGLPRKRRAPA